MIDDIVLTNGEVYAVSVEVRNELVDPAEEITPEIRDEDDEHQTFFTGAGVESDATGANADALVTQAYADSDRNGLPIGLENEVSAVAAGTSELTFTLRHMPPENDSPVKVEGLAEDVAEGGFDAIGGSNDLQITYSLIVE